MVWHLKDLLLLEDFCLVFWATSACHSWGGGRVGCWALTGRGGGVSTGWGGAVYTGCGTELGCCTVRLEINTFYLSFVCVCTFLGLYLYIIKHNKIYSNKGPFIFYIMQFWGVAWFITLYYKGRGSEKSLICITHHIYYTVWHEEGVWKVPNLY